MINKPLLLQAWRLARAGYDTPTFRNANCQGFMTVQGVDSMAIGVAGSNDREDWRLNLRQYSGIHAKVEPVDFMFHGGLWHHSQLLAKALRAKVAQYGMTKTVLIGCHSAGSAAMIGAMIREPRFCGPNVTVVLFGCPPVLDRKGADWFQNTIGARVLNVQARGDLVTKASFFGRWKHVGEIIRIGQDGDFALDHPMAAYLKAIEAERDS